jgi:hypothetical protein
LETVQPLPPLNTVRARARFAAFAVVTIFAGIGVHFHGAPLGYTVRDVLGDALWGMMIYWWVAALAPAAPMRVRAGVAFAICVAVELTQLVSFPLLDTLRHTMFGHMILGSGFDVRDFLAYAAGVVVAFVLERRMEHPA